MKACISQLSKKLDIVVQGLSLYFYHFIYKTAFLLGLYKLSSPSSKELDVYGLLLFSSTYILVLVIHFQFFTEKTDDLSWI